MANKQNLHPPRSTSEARERGKKGGQRSGEAPRQRGRIRRAIEQVLSSRFDIDGVSIEGYEAIAVKMVAEALAGNVQAFKELRDTIGEKPSTELEFGEGNADLRAVKISFVDKSQPMKGKAVGPKIVGAFTAPIGADDE